MIFYYSNIFNFPLPVFASYIPYLNPSYLTFFLFQCGDKVPADSILVDFHTIYSDESSLTGEALDVKKNRADDCFLLSSCLITEGDKCSAIVIGIGTFGINFLCFNFAFIYDLFTHFCVDIHLTCLLIYSSNYLCIYLYS